MNILEKIIESKKAEVARRKELYPVKLLEESIYFQTPVVSFADYLRRADKVGIIAEIKRKSPSEGDINPYIDVEQLSIGYMQAGASALSVLTDTDYFGGSNSDLTTARKYNYCPVLRKDFIIDEYQLVEARSIGADAVLLIGAALPSDRVRALATFAVSLGLEVLLEVRDREELEDCFCDGVSAVGVNNRDLRDFSVSIDTSLDLADQIPSGVARVSESGISSPETIVKLAEAGYNGFLIGSYFMRHAEPQQACARLVKRVEQLMPKTASAS